MRPQAHQRITEREEPRTGKRIRNPPLGAGNMPHTHHEASPQLVAHHTQLTRLTPAGHLHQSVAVVGGWS